MSRYNKSMRNASGYVDLTAYGAIKNANNVTLEESSRFHNLLDTIFYIIELAGFEVKGRIVLKDKKTGKTWR